LFFFPPGVFDLAGEKILKLNADKKLRLRMGEEARRTVLERFTTEKVVPRYEEIYRRVVSG